MAKKFSYYGKKIKTKRDKNDLLKCKGRLENAPLLYEPKAPY